MTQHTVTVRRSPRKREGHQQVVLAFSKLPGQEFGPYPWPEAVTDLTVSALLTRPAARDLVLTALADGRATGIYDPEGDQLRQDAADVARWESDGGR